MSNYRVKHFESYWKEALEHDVNGFINDNNIEVLKYTLHIYEDEAVNISFLGVLEYEELDHET